MKYLIFFGIGIILLIFSQEIIMFSKIVIRLPIVYIYTIIDSWKQKTSFPFLWM